MSVVGIIAEYNPFHKGHAYHIAKAKEITGADYAVVVMSGDFVQRGEPAIIDKYSRTRMALHGGADLVLELPVYYATASAELFATGAVLLLEQLGIVDYLCFGSEEGDISPFLSLADTLMEEPEDYQLQLQRYLKEGYSFPKARSLALGSPAILDSPNNILGLEYCKAIKKYGCRMKPVTIPRLSAGYHDTLLRDHISSATAIRLAMEHDLPADALPEASLDILQTHYKNSKAPTCPIDMEDCRTILYYKMMEHMDQLSEFGDISPQMADRMKRVFSLDHSISAYCDLIKNKSLTLTRIQRCLIHLLLDLKDASRQEAYQHGAIFYGRLLGFCKSSSHLLRMIQDKQQIPIITKVADGQQQLSGLPHSEIAQAMWQQDLHAAHIYQLLVSQVWGTVLPNEYQHGPEHIL